MDGMKEPRAATDTTGDPPGIVVFDGFEPPRRPVISAFIWGSPQPALPTLPFGRWKGSAA
jgi:hypothetical protein